ncbi:MAG TPA: polyprenyl synthetase family protein [Candidatus Binatia bacterium]|nr:polyprenyl synthetase family protein [Candidatus Binatia bacterium]
MSEKKLMEQAISIFDDKGKDSVKLAKLEIFKEEIQNSSLEYAVKFFMDKWNDILHPALLRLACEAVGGNPDATTQIGAAIVLLAGGADIHDDIIDQSTAKGTNQTVFGKFGVDIAVLAGDALLLKGLYLLHESCDLLALAKKRRILKIVKEAFLESSSAEAMEASLRGKTDVEGEKILHLIRQKVATAEAVTRIGAVLGNATERNITVLGHYGRSIGMLMTLRDEFVDIFEADELANRAEREILPLPILLAMNDETRKGRLLNFLKKGKKLSEEDIDEVLDLSLETQSTRDLLEFMKNLIMDEKNRLSSLVRDKNILELLLDATLENL